MSKIAQIVAQRLAGQSQQYLQDIVDHGIHNITNDYADSIETYDEYAREFHAQATELLSPIND